MSETPPSYLYQDLEYLGNASTFIDEVLETTRQAEVFDPFYPNEIEILCQFMHCFAAPDNTVLLQEGEEGDHLIIILSGRVAVRKIDVMGKTTSIAVVGPGDILGEMSLIDGEHRFASCIAVEPTRFAVLSRMDLTEITALHPRLANKFLFMLLQIMVDRLRDTGMRMVTETSNPAV
jgi:CRP/FNR family cyclic AMP-dependent transcriptional regulator